MIDGMVAGIRARWAGGSPPRANLLGLLAYLVGERTPKPNPKLAQPETVLLLLLWLSGGWSIQSELISSSSAVPPRERTRRCDARCVF